MDPGAWYFRSFETFVVHYSTQMACLKTLLLFKDRGMMYPPPPRCAPVKDRPLGFLGLKITSFISILKHEIIRF